VKVQRVASRKGALADKKPPQAASRWALAISNTVQATIATKAVADGQRCTKTQHKDTDNLSR
jgi:hypothetical protein